MAANSKPGLRYDDFVAKVRPDPKSTEALVMLQGYIGKSDLDGHVRVYSDPELSDFIEIPERDIHHAETVKHEEDPLGGSRLWVRKTTVFTAGDPGHANRVKSSFLDGDLVQAFGNTDQIPTVVVTTTRLPVSVPATCQISFYKPNCPVFSATNPACDVSYLRPSCVKTCLVIECVRPTQQKSCGFVCTAKPLCNIKTETCPPSKLICPSKYNCPTNVGCPSVAICPSMPCPSTPECPSFGACPTIACQQETTTIYYQPNMQQASPRYMGYEGGFNPYDTANFGY